MDLSALPHAEQVAAILTASRKAVFTAAMRLRGKAGGRPKSADRCPCGLMTVARAAKRKHVCAGKLSEPLQRAGDI